MTKQNLLLLYHNLLRIRLVEEEIARKYKEQEMRCPVHLCIGQEAIAAGVSFLLHKEDIVFSGHRSHGHYLAKGGSLRGMIAEIYGKQTGCSLGRGGSQHLIDLQANFYGANPIVAETIPVAVGTGLAQIYQKTGNIVTVYFGDAATEEGATFESLNYASLKNLPVLFICENNLYSISTHIRERQPKRNIYTIAKAIGIKAYSGDGMDILQVLELTKKALSYMRKTQKPVFIEFATYRFLEHVGPNPDPAGSRPEKEKNYWRKKCPVKQFEKYLLEQKILNPDLKNKIITKINDEIKDAFRMARESPYPEGNLEEKQAYG
ncbi:thiamine pyrophosphate-dependent dehydrogenase E1 component subunit alpha [Candidatus Gottesmanbacteria bacterium]|nr:thiamine pyrophosphate-dependent dehydrogenase E1 component subunit alpha [Candidatus Gottesmanbacteria bacterium]